MHLTALHDHLGVTLGPRGHRLRVWSGAATSMTLVLLERDGRIAAHVPMTPQGDGVWEAVSGMLEPGRRYAVTADGPAGPRDAFNRDALLLDPYARGVERRVPDDEDSPWVGVVVADDPFDWGGVSRPNRSLDEVVLYEAHVAGLTRTAPHVPAELRGTYAGLAHDTTIEYLRSLGVTAIELLPVQAFGSEAFLREQGLRNYWGYNTVGFFAPHTAYASPAARAAGHEAVIREFKGMVRNLHQAGIEVYLDVVYNHTAEEGRDGDTISFRGLDNAAYYRLDDAGQPIDVTGCGNSINASHPIVQQLVLDSLIHWVEEFGIDGFRFDLATTLGRGSSVEFDPEHGLLEAIVDEPRLDVAKIIAEPWDVGLGGWQTGNFPEGWSEWNDKFRDRVRSFWVRDLAEARFSGLPPEGVARLVTAFSGSSNLFVDERGPLASVNFVTAHDGFTVRDLVSYNVKHNLLNGELGRDGTTNNHSYNFGSEGPSRDAAIEADRRLAMRNLLGTLLLSAGIPMLTMGDEVARTQHGNNNPYNQDSPLTWFDWDFDDHALAQRAHVARLTEIRASHPALRPRAFNHGDQVVEEGAHREWFDALGNTMPERAWNDPVSRTVQCLVSTILPERGAHEHPSAYRHASDAPDALGLAAPDMSPRDVPPGYVLDAVLVVLHGTEDAAILRLPDTGELESFSLLWDSTAERVEDVWLDAATTTVGPGTPLRLHGPSIRVYRANPR